MTEEEQCSLLDVKEHILLRVRVHFFKALL